MRLHSEDIKERLHMIFQKKLLKMWKEDPPPISPEGMYDTEHRMKNALRWIDYIRNMGGRVLEWKDAVNSCLDQGVLFHNPGEHPKDFGKAGASPTYIFMPNEMAMKILAFGDLP